MTKLRKRNKLVFGVGINDADYNVYVRSYINGKYEIVWSCPYYSTWKEMLRRCYSKRYQTRFPTYKECTVCDEWLTFSKFKSWMMNEDWEGKELDKDLLQGGNKVYCPEYCVFVHNKVNSFFNNHGNARGEHMIGANWHRRSKKFTSQCSNPFTNKSEYLGYFVTEIEAHLAWKARKHELACLLADSEYCTDERLSNILRTYYL